MNPTKQFLTKNRCYTKAIKIKPKKLVLHSLGVAQPNADVLIKNWNNSTASVCVHGFIEADRVIQTLPWDYKGWHVGKGSLGSWNGNSIGIEICEPAGHKYKGGSMIDYDVARNADYFNKVYWNAINLFADLCEKYSLDPLKDIFCHSEVHALGYGSNHADVMHWFPKHGTDMDKFRSNVNMLISKNYIPSSTISPESSREDIRWAQRKLNAVLPAWFPKLSEDGIYSPATRYAVLVYWEQLGWGRHMRDSGLKIGRPTIEALAEGRIK